MSVAWIRSIAVTLMLAASLNAGGASLYFTNNFGPETEDVGRVEIYVDGTAADIGAEDFTLEFWMKAEGGNTAGEVGCDEERYNWIFGNIIFDRDRLEPGRRDFGLSLSAGRIAFGVENAQSAYTICSRSSVVSGMPQWRHVAVQREESTGRLWVFVDGVLEAEAQGPAGDISYPNGDQAGTRQPLLTIGREKYDLGPDGYHGLLDEIRLSNILRYQDDFPVRTAPFELDQYTLALYHMDEGAGDRVSDAVDPIDGPHGNIRYSAAAGPEWRTDTPFSQPDSPGQLRFTSNNYQANEAAGTTIVSVTRINGSSGAVSVTIAAAGTATAGADYSFSPSTLSWAHNETGPKNITVAITNDLSVEAEETVVFSLSDPIGGAFLVTPSSATLTISDNDAPPTPNPGALQFSTSAVTVNEAGGSVTLTVSRVGGVAGAATVDVAAAGGSATAGADYSFTPQTLSWNAGESADRTVTVTINNDAQVEGSETFAVSLSNPTGAALGSPSSATVTIQDDDQPSGGGGGSGDQPSGGGGGGGAAGLLLLLGLAPFTLLRRLRLL